MISKECSISINKYNPRLNSVLSPEFITYEQELSSLYQTDDVKKVLSAVDAKGINDEENVKTYVKNTYNVDLSVVSIEEFLSSPSSSIISIPNANNISIVSLIDSITRSTSKTILLRDIHTSPIDSTIYILSIDPSHIEQDTNNETSIPDNTETLIDFLYNVYSYRHYYLSTILSYLQSSTPNSIRYVNITPKREFEQLFMLLGIFQNEQKQDESH